MQDELKTAAVFGDHTQALVVRNFLEEAGIPAFLTDELMSQGLFVLGGAVGGIRVQVPASRLDEAVRAINDRMPEHTAPVNWSEVDVGQPETDEAIEDEAFSPKPRSEPTSPAVEAVVEIEPRDLTLREQRADRIVRGACIGLFAWPVLVLAVWRIVQIANSQERLRPEFERKANIGAMLVGLGILEMLSCWCFLPGLLQAIAGGF